MVTYNIYISDGNKRMFKGAVEAESMREALNTAFPELYFDRWMLKDHLPTGFGCRRGYSSVRLHWSVNTGAGRTLTYNRIYTCRSLLDFDDGGMSGHENLMNALLGLVPLFYRVDRETGTNVDDRMYRDRWHIRSLKYDVANTWIYPEDKEYDRRVEYFKNIFTECEEERR